MTIRFLSLFAGIGGFDLGLERASWQCVGQVEIDPFCRRVLARHWPNVERFDDVRDVTGQLIRERCGAVDAVVGGFPCQDISIANSQAIGIDGDRSGLWREQYRIIRELRPRIGLMENVAALLDRGLGRVLGDLARIGYDAEWSIVSACALGAPHMRRRLFIVAYPSGFGGRRRRIFAESGEPSSFEEWQAIKTAGYLEISNKYTPNDYLRSRANGISGELATTKAERLRGVGNAVAPPVAQWIGERINAALDS